MLLFSSIVCKTCVIKMNQSFLRMVKGDKREFVYIKGQEFEENTSHVCIYVSCTLHQCII